MLRLLRYMLLLLSLVSIHCSQQTKKKKLSHSLNADLPILLPEGKYKADIMDNIKYTAEQIAVNIKFQKAFKENYTWFLEYMKNVPEGEPLPYHEKMGITEKEYQVILHMGDSIEISSSATENLTIIHDKDKIKFKGTGRLAVFDSLQIDLQNHFAQFRQYKIPYSDTVSVTDDKNGMKSKWFGYGYKMEEPKGRTMDDLKDIYNLNMKVYSLTIGRLEKNGKTLLNLSGSEIIQSQRIVDIKVPVVF